MTAGDGRRLALGLGTWIAPFPGQETLERRLDELSTVAPGPGCAWTVGEPNVPPAFHCQPRLAGLLGLEGPPDHLEPLARRLDAAAAARLMALAARLGRAHPALAETLPTPDGRLLAVTGRWLPPVRRAPGVAVLWFQELGPVAARLVARAAAADAAEARLDGLPMPAWWLEGAGPAGNAAFRALAGAPGAPLWRAVARLAERAGSGSAPAEEERHVVVDGRRLRLALSAVPLAEGRVVGAALDRTELEALQGEFDRHLAAQAEVLEQLRTAVAIYGPDMRLTFWNSAWLQLWGLDGAWARRRPSLGEVLELLRERRLLPEQADFRRFKAQRLELFRTLTEPAEELLYRPDGTVLRMLTVPHPLGGLLFTLEDVSSRLALQSSLSTLTAVARETLDTLVEGVAVVGGDGRLKQCNPAFARLWGLDPELVARGPHIGALADLSQDLFIGGGASWAEIRQRIVTGVLERTQRAGRTSLADGRVLDWRLKPLPDGGTLISCLDVTDSARAEAALAERNEALEREAGLRATVLGAVTRQARPALDALVAAAERLVQGPAAGTEGAAALVEAVRALGRSLEAVRAVAAASSAGPDDRPRLPLAELIERATPLCRAAAATAAARLADPALLPGGRLIEGDAAALAQALGHLAEVAARLSSPEGPVTLAAAPSGTDRVALSLAGPGGGAPADQAWLERQLALVRAIAESHGGRLQVDLAGAGGPVAFTLVLPTVPERTA